MLWYTCEQGRFPGQLNNYSPGASGTYVRLNFEAHTEDASHADSAAAVAWQALDELQDFVDEARHEPWPGTGRPPRPFAEVRGEILHLWCLGRPTDRAHSGHAPGSDRHPDWESTASAALAFALGPAHRGSGIPEALRGQMARQSDGEARWEYTTIWRYGALLLIGVGLLAMGFGASGLTGTAMSAILVPIGFVSLVAGVVLPRIEGKLTVGPSQISAQIIRVDTLDQVLLTTSEPAVVLREVETASGRLAIEITQPPGSITIGDVWDALIAAGVRIHTDDGLNSQAIFEGVGLGKAYFRLHDGRQLRMPNKGFVDYGAASDELLALVASWGIHATASGKYPLPAEEYRSIARQPPVFVLPPPPYPPRTHSDN